MANDGLEMCNYEPYQEKSTEPILPARYTRQPRGGKRRKSTLVKREKWFSLEMQDETPLTGEEKYKIPSEDSSGSSVDENYEIDSISSSIVDSLTWRGRMQVALHSAWIHIIIVLLVVADALIVIFELLLDVGAFNNLQCEGETKFEQKEFCHYIMRGDGCGPPAKLILERLNISASPGSGIGEDGLCTCKFRNGKRICDDSDGDAGVNPALVLHVVSLLILTLFVIEIILKLIAFRLKYFTHRFEVFDGLIVCLSYMLDWASLHEEEAFEAASLVIILRLWRVVRIVNGAVLSSKSRSDQQLAEARLKARKIIHAFHKAQDRLDVMEEENKKLKRVVALGKAVRVHRGNYQAKSDTQPTTDKHVKPSDEKSEVAEKPEPPKMNDDPLPNIVITQSEGSDM